VTSVEYRFLRPDGTWGWLDSQRLSQKTGDTLQILGVTQDITRRKETEERLTLLLRELSHRVKNQFAIVMATVRAVAPNSRNADGVRAAIAERVQALAHAHDLLVGRSWSGVDLRDIIIGQVEPFGLERFDIAGAPVSITPSAVQYLAMAFFELATNAAKYGALSMPNGRVAVEWRVTRSEAGPPVLEVEWREDAGRKRPARKKGFGSRVLERITPSAVGGSASLDVSDGRLVWRLRAGEAIAAVPVDDPATRPAEEESSH
jgi:two-component sensor histidine kinase